MRTRGWVALSALVVSACGDDAAPPAKPPTTTAVAPKDSTPPAPRAPPPPLTEIPATSSNPDAAAAYRTALDLTMNGHPGDETRPLLKKAVDLDPSFASAIAYLGFVTPGAEGDAMIASAIAKAKGLSDSEMLYLQTLQIGHLGDNAKWGEGWKKLAATLPAAPRAQFMYAGSLYGQGDFDGAKAAYRNTIDLAPDFAAALNELAYLEMYLGESDAAVAHLHKYGQVRPKEPNAADSLAEALMLAAKLDDAEASFKQALDLDPKMSGAMSGLGFVTLYRGDTAKGLDALVKYRDLPTLTYQEKAAGYYDVAWTQLALGKTADAMKTVDAWEAEAKKSSDTESPFWPATVRVELLNEVGRNDEAIKQVAAIDTRITQSSAPALRKSEWRLFLRTDETIANARLKKAADADKSRALAETAAGEVGGSEGKVWSAIARGEALMAKGDAAGAAKEFAACPSGESYCVWERMKAEDKAASKTEAAADKDRLGKERRRRGFQFYVWTKVTPPPAKK